MNSLKNTNHWPLQVKLGSEEVTTGMWESIRWSIEDLLPASEPLNEGYQPLVLELFKDERTAYRFNLNSESPRLFILCDEDDVDELLTPVHITASQDEASSYMDGEHQVLSCEMPAAIQCWIDTFLGIHGELVDEGRKKKRKGKGRSSGN